MSNAAVNTNGALATINPQDEQVMDLPARASAGLIDDDASCGSFEHESTFPISMSFEEPQLVSGRNEDKDAIAREHAEETKATDVPEDGSSQTQTGTSNDIVESAHLDFDTAQAGDSEVQVAQRQADAFTEPFSDGRSLIDDQPEGQPAAEQPVATDPWDDPLPAWDYSQNEWPVLVATRRRTTFGAFRASLVVLLVLSAAGFYFFIFQPALREPRSTAPVNTKTVEPAAAVSNPEVTESKAAEPVPSPNASAPASEAPASVDSKPVQVSEVGDARGKFSLQAAAFPTQAGADEFREKLRQAGLPSYVVGADLGRRGRWFRVRLGRFNSAEDAQKFAGQAQLRAKAAGMSLQLIGCEYDQP